MDRFHIKQIQLYYSTLQLIVIKGKKFIFRKFINNNSYILPEYDSIERFVESYLNLHECLAAHDLKAGDTGHIPRPSLVPEVLGIGYTRDKQEGQHLNLNISFNKRLGKRYDEIVNIRIQ